MLCPGNNDYLFPGRGRNANGQIRIRIVDAVRASTGLTVTPDLFKHFAAKHFLAANPNGFPTIRYLLGHNSLAFTETYYAGLSARTAFRAIDSELFT
jgi:integrase